jgi:hypothetical protein
MTGTGRGELPSTREAESAAREQGAALAGHGYRTWILGHALARQDRRALDPELFYVAALLHDAGIVRVVAGEDFTIRSARVVSEVAARVRPEDSSLATSLADSVVAHATPGLGSEIAFRAHPANDVFGVVAASITAEARAVPRGRFAVLRRSGMSFMVRFSPNRQFE